MLTSTADNCVRSLAILDQRHTAHIALNTWLGSSKQPAFCKTNLGHRYVWEELLVLAVYFPLRSYTLARNTHCAYELIPKLPYLDVYFLYREMLHNSNTWVFYLHYVKVHEERVNPRFLISWASLYITRFDFVCTASHCTTRVWLEQRIVGVIIDKEHSSKSGCLTHVHQVIATAPWLNVTKRMSKRKLHEYKVVEHDSFSPLVFTSSGGMGPIVAVVGLPASSPRLTTSRVESCFGFIVNWPPSLLCSAIRISSTGGGGRGVVSAPTSPTSPPILQTPPHNIQI